MLRVPLLEQFLCDLGGVPALRVRLALDPRPQADGQSDARHLHRRPLCGAGRSWQRSPPWVKVADSPDTICETGRVKTLAVPAGLDGWHGGRARRRVDHDVDVGVRRVELWRPVRLLRPLPAPPARLAEAEHRLRSRPRPRRPLSPHNHPLRIVAATSAHPPLPPAAPARRPRQLDRRHHDANMRIPNAASDSHVRASSSRSDVQGTSPVHF